MRWTCRRVSSGEDKVDAPGAETAKEPRADKYKPVLTGTDTMSGATTFLFSTDSTELGVDLRLQAQRERGN